MAKGQRELPELTMNLPNAVGLSWEKRGSNFQS